MGRQLVGFLHSIGLEGQVFHFPHDTEVTILELAACLDNLSSYNPPGMVMIKDLLSTS